MKMSKVRKNFLSLRTWKSKKMCALETHACKKVQTKVHPNLILRKLKIYNKGKENKLISSCYLKL